MNRTTVTVVLGTLLLCTVGRVVYVEWVPGPLDRSRILRACDFQVLYLSGKMIAQGEAARLYDHPHLQELQGTLAPLDNERNPPGFLFYPPMAPLLVSPLSRLPYQPAVAIWWLTQAICFLATGWLLRAEIRIEAAWRPAAWLALLAFYPLWDTVLRGQLSAVLLLAVAGAFRLQRGRHPIWAGLVLSLLAMKPQFFVGGLLWLLLRRDWRTAAATADGLMLQLAVVAAILGPSVLAGYVSDWPVCANLSLIYHLAPWAEHGLGITAENVFAALGCNATASHHAGMLLQLLVAAGAAWLLLHVIPAPGSPPSPQEQAGAVLFMLLVTPHVLLYDLSLLAVPLVYLWSSGRWRLGAVLYLATSALAIPVYDRVGFSIVPAVLLAGLFRLRRSRRQPHALATQSVA